MTDTTLRAEPMYVPYQVNFIQRFIAEIKPGSIHILLAPDGSGKSTVVAGTISELVRTGRMRRILILTLPAVIAQWTSLLEPRALAPVAINSQALRLIREQLGNSLRGWQDGIYSMSIDLAKRSDVCEFVSSVGWNLVVVDEAPQLSGKRLQLIQSLLAKEDPPSLLLVTNVQSEGTRAFAERATLIDWTEAVAELRSRQEVDANGAPLRVTRSYRRSEEEVALAAGVVDNARQLGQLKGMVLLQRAASSISSLEDSLVRWVEEFQGGVEHIEALEELLQRVEQLRVDSRLKCFQGLLEELIGAGVRHVVTFCEYRSTLDYLLAAVEQRDFTKFEVHAGLADERRQEAISQFEKEGGLLVATTAAIRGLEFTCEAAIHYDLPMSPAKFAAREAHYRWYRASRRCTAYFLEDEAGALPLEDYLLRMVRKQNQVTGEMDIDVDRMFRTVVK